MIDDLAWRKFPRDIIRNENLDYIASLMEPGNEALPLLLYVVAYCKADDNGCFDIANGVIFSRLVKLGTVSDLFYAAELMEQQGLIQRVADDCNVFIITDWENPNRSGRNASVPLTADQRRVVVAQKIAAAKKSNLNDKNSNNVAKTNFFAQKTTNFENLSLKQREREERYRQTDERETEKRERETDFRDERKENLDTNLKDTHTDSKTSGNYNEPTVLQGRSVQNKTYNAEPLRDQEKIINSCADLASQALIDTQDNNFKQENENAHMSEVCDALTIFFAKNDISFNSRVQQPEVITTIQTIAERIITLSSDKNPPNIVASVFLGAFKKLSTSEGYYKDIELTPENMLKPGPWGKILYTSSNSLLTRSVPNISIWEQQLEEYQKDYEMHHAQIDNLMQQDLLKYGIDPEDPDRLGKLLKAQAGEHGTRDTG